VGSILAEILGIPVVTFACSIEAADRTLKIKRLVKDGFEVVEAPMPSVVTVSSEIGLPRLPGGMGLMMARRKVIPIWKAADIGAEAAKLDKANTHSEITGLSIPVRKSECEIIAGATPAEAAGNLAAKIIGLA
jgi:electron transfer flavoprotein beta subunit